MTAQSTTCAKPDAAGLDLAADLLSHGEPVAVPTETVYGLAGDATRGAALTAIYAAKGRPAFNPLICHVADRTMAEGLAVFTPAARALADAFWPGPLTLVLTARAESPVASLAQAGLDTVALRCPDAPVMQALIRRLNRPLAAPSANRSGNLSPTTAAHVMASLGGRIPLVLDGGPCPAGLESTIVDARGEPLILLRPGPVTPEEIAARCGLAVSRATPTDAILAPGQLASHYAPEQPVRLNALTARPGDFHIGFGAIAGDLSLSPAGDLSQAAANLFEVLHAAQASGAAAIAIAPIPDEGLGQAINDRLRRAAAPRR